MHSLLVFGRSTNVATSFLVTNTSVYVTGKSQLARINGDNNLIAITEMRGCPHV